MTEASSRSDRTILRLEASATPDPEIISGQFLRYSVHDVWVKMARVLADQSGKICFVFRDWLYFVRRIGAFQSLFHAVMMSKTSSFRILCGTFVALVCTVSLGFSGTIRPPNAPFDPLAGPGLAGPTSGWASPVPLMLPFPGPATEALPNLPFDFKKQALEIQPFSESWMPQESVGPLERKPIPNLDPLITQIIRHANLATDANKILPWIYATTTEMVVADFEDALMEIEEAGVLVEQAMLNVLMDTTLQQSNLALAEATSKLDRAEFTILLLMELARLEL